MKALLTGATGFLGSWMARKLIGEGISVRILCRPTSDLSELAGLEYEKVFGDITDPSSLETAFEGVDSVFHYAGLIAYKSKDRALMEKINVEGTRNIVDLCVAKKIRRLLHVSSVVAIGAAETKDQKPLTENSSFNLRKWNLGYAETKLAAENYVLRMVKEKGLDAVVVNPSTAYGAGDARKGTRKTQVKVARGEFPFYPEGGVNIAHVEDVTNAAFAAWKTGLTGERYILAGENLTIKEMFDLVAFAAGVEPPKRPVPTKLLLMIGWLGDFALKLNIPWPISYENARMGSLYHWFDPSKAVKDLGLKIRPAKESIGDSVRWMKKSGYLD